MNTIEIYMRYVKEFKDVNESLETMLNKYKNKSISTRRIMLSSVKSYLTFTNNKEAEIVCLPKKNISVSDFITFEDYKKIISEINFKTKMGFQKRIIIRLLFETGIRSSELLKIKKDSIYLNRIKIHGKGNKERYVNISDWLLDELNYYMKSINTERLFPFTYKNLYDKIKRLDNIRSITPHMFRRGYAKYCNHKNIPIYEISISMGHSSINTTASYINKKSEDVNVSSIF